MDVRSETAEFSRNCDDQESGFVLKKTIITEKELHPAR